MKSKWSSKWKSSVQPRKQRKYRHNAPLHVRHKMVSARLSKDLKSQLGKRSLPIRKGDEVKVMTGSKKRSTGAVARVDLSSLKIFIDGVTAKKVDGSEVMVPIDPSNLVITKINTDDKMRRKQLDRKAVPAKKENKPK